jgi:hypothetical protein
MARTPRGGRGPCASPDAPCSDAKARTHGSSTNDTRGDPITVSATTMADGQDAKALADCKGAKNCDSPYSAHSEAHYTQGGQTGPAHRTSPAATRSPTARAPATHGDGKGGCGVHVWPLSTTAAPSAPARIAPASSRSRAGPGPARQDRPTLELAGCKRRLHPRRGPVPCRGRLTTGAARARAKSRAGLGLRLAPG